MSSGRLSESFLVALNLFGHIAQRVGRAFAVVFVDCDEIREIEHVDFFELARRAVFGRHHVQRHIDMRHDGRVALADARGFDDHKIEARDLAGGDHIGQRGRDFAASVARRERTHEDLVPMAPRADRIHADAVAKQGAAAFAPRRIDRDHRDIERIVLVEAQTADEFIGQRRFARAAGAGDAD